MFEIAKSEFRNGFSTSKLVTLPNPGPPLQVNKTHEQFNQAYGDEFCTSCALSDFSAQWPLKLYNLNKTRDNKVLQY